MSRSWEKNKKNKKREKEKKKTKQKPQTYKSKVSCKVVVLEVLVEISHESQTPKKDDQNFIQFI